MIRIVPEPGRVIEGQVLWRGRDLLTLPPRELRAIRGREISMIFQDPTSSLNPVFTIGEQIAGQPPDLTQLPEGCPFRPRCAWSRDACKDVTMELVPAGPLHGTACPFFEELR